MFSQHARSAFGPASVMRLAVTEPTIERFLTKF